MKRLGKFRLVKMKKAKSVYVLGDKIPRTTLIENKKRKRIKRKVRKKREKVLD